LADRIERYRGYELRYYCRDRVKVRVLFEPKEAGLPSINGGPQEDSLAAAEKAAKKVIDETLATDPSN
jgi:hypothetical protein